jgi:hypothetical protein
MKTIKDIVYVTVVGAVNEHDENEYHLEARFTNGEKYTIGIFDEDAGSIADDVCKFLNEKARTI